MMVAVSVRSDHVGPIEDQLPAFTGFKIKIFYHGRDQRDPPFDQDMLVNQLLHGRRVFYSASFSRHLFFTWQDYYILSRINDAGDLLHQLLLLVIGQVMDIDNIFELADADAAGPAANTVFIQNFFDIRVLIDDFFNAFI